MPLSCCARRGFAVTARRCISSNNRSSSSVAAGFLFPYGEASFEVATRSQQWVVDRTPFLPRLLELPRAVLFTRPRRFGKSFTWDMLAHFLDARHDARAFADLFGRTWIGDCDDPNAAEARTKHAGRYMVLRLDMTGPPTVAVLDSAVRTSIARFADAYGSQFDARAAHPEGGASLCVTELSRLVHCAGQQLVVLIDEYDHALNQLLAQPTTANHSSVLADIEPGVRDIHNFYETLKGLIGINQVHRVFLTGVTPLVLVGLGSGFNIAYNITFDPRFERMCGLEEHEVREGIVLALLAREAGGRADRLDLMERARAGNGVNAAEVDTHLARIRDWYNGYRFSQDALLDEPVPRQGLYNPQMVLRYLTVLHQMGWVRDHHRHDGNTQLSDVAVQVIGSMRGSSSTLSALVAGRPRLCARPYESLTLTQLHDAAFDDDDSAVQSMLVHFGAATFQRDDSVEGGIALAVPNRVVLEDYVSALSRKVESSVRQQLGLHTRAAVENGDVAGFVDAVMSSGLFAEVIEARALAGGKLEFAFHERLLVLARLVLPHEKWSWLRAEEFDECDWVDLELGPPAGPARAVVELQAVPIREVEGALAKMLGRTRATAKASTLKATTLPRWLDEQVASMEDDELVSAVPSIGKVLEAATEQVRKYRKSAAGAPPPRRFVAVMVTPTRALVREVGEG